MTHMQLASHARSLTQTKLARAKQAKQCEKNCYSGVSQEVICSKFLDI